jgi:hypothetical protein
VTWHYFDLSSGILQGRTFRCSDPSVRPPEIAGLGTIQGVIDWHSQRVDITTRALVDYTPPPPDADHEWIHDDEHGKRVRRWMLKPGVSERRDRIAAILAELSALDARLIRPLGELAGAAALDSESIVIARTMVDEINTAKDALRAELRGLSA